MKRLIVLLFALAPLGCSERPHFELRGVTTKAEEKTSTTYYTATGTIIGSGAAAAKPFWVMYEVKITGGNPEWAPPRRDTPFLVNGGIGDVEIYLGYRDKGATWPAPAVELIPLGYLAITPFK